MPLIPIAIQEGLPANDADILFPLEIPFDDTGSRIFSVNVGNAIYQLNSYYVVGYQNYWLFDVADTNGNNLAVGVKIVPGAANTLKGISPEFYNENWLVTLASGTPNASDALGNNLYVSYYAPGQPVPYDVGDVWDALGETIKILEP